MIIYLLSVISAFLIATGLFGLIIRFMWRYYGTMVEAVLIGLAPIHYNGRNYHYIYDIGDDDKNQLLFSANAIRKISDKANGDKHHVYFWDKFDNIATFDTKIMTLMRYCLFVLSGVYIAVLLHDWAGNLMPFMPLMVLSFIVTNLIMYRKLQDLNTHQPRKIRDIKKFKNTLAYRNDVQKKTTYGKFGLFILCCFMAAMVWHDRTKITLYLIGDKLDAQIISYQNETHFNMQLTFPKLSYTDKKGDHHVILNAYGYDTRAEDSDVQILHAYLPEVLTHNKRRFNQAYAPSAMIDQGILADYKYFILLMMLIYLWVARPSKIHL